MAYIRTTFSLDEKLAARAKKFGVNVSAAAREGVAAAVRSALAQADREAYARRPERPDEFWDAAEAWSQQ